MTISLHYLAIKAFPSSRNWFARDKFCMEVQRQSRHCKGKAGVSLHMAHRELQTVEAPIWDWDKPMFCTLWPRTGSKAGFPHRFSAMSMWCSALQRKLEWPHMGLSPKSLKVLEEDETITMSSFQYTACPPHTQPLLRKTEGTRSLALRPPASSERREREYFLLALLKLENKKNYACR